MTIQTRINLSIGITIATTIILIIVAIIVYAFASIFPTSSDNTIRTFLSVTLPVVASIFVTHTLISARSQLKK